jgi:hypothetical protein
MLSMMHGTQHHPYLVEAPNAHSRTEPLAHKPEPDTKVG